MINNKLFAKLSLKFVKNLLQCIVYEKDDLISYVDLGACAKRAECANARNGNIRELKVRPALQPGLYFQACGRSLADFAIYSCPEFSPGEIQRAVKLLASGSMTYCATTNTPGICESFCNTRQPTAKALRYANSTIHRKTTCPVTSFLGPIVWSIDVSQALHRGAIFSLVSEETKIMTSFFLLHCIKYFTKSAPCF